MADSDPRTTRPLAVALAVVLIGLLILIVGVVWLRRGASRLSLPLPRPPAPARPHLPNVPPLPQRPHVPTPIPRPR